MKRRPAPTQKKLRIPGRVVLLVVLAVLGAVAYHNSFSVPFVFDDALSIQRNTGDRFGEIDRNPLAGRALLYVTFTLNYLWTGQDVWSYHLINLLFHIIN